MSNFDDIFEVQPTGGGSEERPFDKEAWAEQKQAERKAAYELADATALEVAGDGDKFRDYLDLQTRMSYYSVTNALLILAQKPLATQLKDFDSWEKEGASIRRNQNAISILEPGNEYKRNDGSIGTSYNVKKVFDISQTTARGKAQPTVSTDDRLLLKALIHRSPVPIQMTDELPGNSGAVYDYDQKAILVRRGMEAPDLFRCVSVALARAEMDVSGGISEPAQAAFPAYCVSYMLCRQNGVDISGYNFSQLPESLTQADAREIRETLSEIKDTAHTISARMSRVLEQNKTPRAKEQER